MDKFLETYNLPQLNLEEIEDLNRLIIRILLNNQKPPKKGPDGFTGELH